jgi:putative transposase
MKQAGFTEEQTIVVLKEHEAGAKTADPARKARDLGGDILQVEANYGGMDVSEASG